MEIIRNGELQELIDVINTNPYGKILISGIAGSGKTFLLNTIGKILEERGSKIIYGVSAFSHINSKALNDYYDIENVVYLVDGLDETFRYKHIVDRIKNNRGCWICTARNNIFDIKFDYEIELKALTNEQTLLLINDYLGSYFSSEDVIKEIFRGIGEESVTPRILTEKLYSKLNAEGINKYFLGLKTDIHQLYTYGGGLSLQHPEIIVPERKIIKVPNEIKQDINVVTRSLLDKVALKPDILREITPRQFEELICELFERKGYNVQLTKQTKDGGKDLIILNNSILGDLMIYAECKKYSPKYPVNVGLVRELYGTVEADRATAGIMVTTSHFSTDARRFQQQIKGRMNLIDYSELMNQIMDCR